MTTPSATPPADQALPAPPPRAAIWMLGAGETLIWAALFYVFATLLLEWERTLGWAKTDLTLGITTAILMAALSSPIAGRLIDAGHGRWVMGGGALGGSLALAALSTAETPLMFTVFWALIGISQAGCLYEPCFSIVTRAAGANARPAITKITLLGGLASPIAFLSGAAITDALGWQTTVLIFAAVAAFIAAPLLYIGAMLLERAHKATSTPTTASDNRAALRRSLHRPEFWLIAIAFPLMALNHGILLNHIVPLLVEREITERIAFLVAATIGPMQVLGRAVLMMCEKRISSVASAAVAFGGVTAASLILLVSGASPALAFAFAALQGATYGLTSILKPAITAEFLGRTGFGAIAGWLALPYLAGFAFAPHLGSLIWTAGGYDSVIPVTAAIGALGVFCVMALAMLRRRS